MRARERLPGQLTATCFHIAILPLPPPFPFFLPLSRPLLSSSRFNPPTLMNPLARMQVAKRQLSSRERKRERELRTSCFDHPPTSVYPFLAQFLEGNKTAGNATPASPDRLFFSTQKSFSALRSPVHSSALIGVSTGERGRSFSHFLSLSHRSSDASLLQAGIDGIDNASTYKVEPNFDKIGTGVLCSLCIIN